MGERVIVVGAGHAGGQCAARLRAEGYAGDVLVLGAEPLPPYQRPPLSKAYLAAEVGMQRVLLRPESFYAEQRIEVRVGAAVTAIDRAAAQVQVGSERLDYTALVLATGAQVRRLRIEGSEQGGVHYLRTAADADALRARLRTGARAVVIGGGYIGLEAAAVMARAGLRVTVLEAQPRILARVAGEEVAAHLHALHRDHGVTIRCAVEVAAIEGDGYARGVRLADGEVLPCDLLLVGIGIWPDTALASAAGLAVDDGIVVDEACRTADPRILAIGDCAACPSALYGRRLRLESVHNAMSQARVAAANLAGKTARYDEVPWFWSDQYDAKLQIAGVATGATEWVLRGTPASGSFTVFALRDGRLLAAESVNAMREHLACRQLVGRALDADRLADPEVALQAP